VCAKLRGMMKGFVFKSKILKMPAANCGRFSLKEFGQEQIQGVEQAASLFDAED